MNDLNWTLLRTRVRPPPPPPFLLDKTISVGYNIIERKKMKPLKIEPKEVDIIVASLGNSLDIWGKRIDSGDLPEDFDDGIAESLFLDMLATYDKFLEFQDQMSAPPKDEIENLPENVLPFRTSDDH